MKRWVRQHRYALSTAVSRLVAQPFSSLANLLVMTLTLAVPLIGWALLVSAQPLAQSLPVNPELTVFLQMEQSEEHAETLQQQWITQWPDEIARIHLQNRNEAYEALHANPLWTEVLDTLDANPLPHALVIQLADTVADSAATAMHLAAELRTQAAVDRVQLDSEWVQRLEALLRFIRIALGFLSLSVAAIVVATVFNTVRLQALNQREEIGVARLVGATESFVRRPFLYQGALTGALASALACGLGWLSLGPLNQALNSLAQSYDLHVHLHLPVLSELFVAVLFIAAIAALAARWSVSRTTQF